MVAYVIASLYLYRMVRFLFSARVAAWVAAIAFMLNPSVLYMQTTAMSEVPMICTATVAIYYMLVWARSYRPVDLIKSAVAVAAGTGIRYDGWPLAIAFAVVVVYLAWRRAGLQGAQAWGIMYGLLAFAGCAAWVIYNLVVFHDPILFAVKGYSPQQVGMAQYPSYHKAWLSFEFYGYAAGATVGWMTTALAAIGLIVFVARYRLQGSMLPVYGLFVPFAFYWLTFYLSMDTILLPQFGWSTYWNARFGLLMIPAAAFLVGYLATWWRPLLLVVLGAVVWFAVTDSIGQTPLALREPLHSAHSVSTPKLQADWFIKEYHGGNVLVSYIKEAPMMFYIMQHIPDNNVITDVNGSQYRHALKSPQRSVRWVIMDENHSDNPIWAGLHKSRVFHKDFGLRKVLGTTMFYERIPGAGTGVGRESATRPPVPAQVPCITKSSFESGCR